MTSVGYQSDEPFKIWAAEQKLKGVPLVLAQHGGNMGTGFLSQPEHHQVLIADKFCTWGWTSDVDQSIPMPSLSRHQTISLIALMVRYHRLHILAISTVNIVPVASQFLYYLNYQINFLNSLKPYLRFFKYSVKLRFLWLEYQAASC